MNGATAFPASPWTRVDVRRLLVVAGVGSSAVVLGWMFTARRVAVDDQLPWLNLAVIGCLAAAMANATFLLRGYRAVRSRRRWLFAQRSSPQPITTPVFGEPVATTSMTRYHRPDCPFVARKGDALFALPADEHGSAGRTPCPWCAP